MSNESMYNTFVKNRPQNNPGGSRPSSSAAGRDIPDIEIDTDETLDDFAPSDSKREPVGVDSSLSGFAEYLNQNGDPFHDEERPRSILEELEEVYANPDLTKNTYTDPFNFEGGSVSLPNPEVFNSYPPEVQRKIMEWTDRDLKARRDDESRRQDAILRANITRERNKTTIPVIITILLIVCALISGIYTRKAIFSIAFLVVAVIVVIVFAIMKYQQDRRRKMYIPPSGRS